MLLIIPYDHRLPRMKMTGTQRSHPHQALIYVYCCPFGILALGTLLCVCTWWCMYLCLRFPHASKFGIGQRASTLPAARVSWHHHLRKTKNRNELSASEKGPCRHTHHVHPMVYSSSKSSIWANFARWGIVQVSILN